MNEALGRQEQADFQAGENQFAQLRPEASPANDKAEELRESLAGRPLDDKVTDLRTELKAAGGAAVEAQTALRMRFSHGSPEAVASAETRLAGVRTEYTALLQANPDLVGPLYYDKLSRTIDQRSTGRSLVTTQDQDRARTMLARAENGWRDDELAILETKFLQQPGITEDTKSAVVNYALEQHTAFRGGEAPPEIAEFVSSARLQDRLKGPDARDQPATSQDQRVDAARAALEAAISPAQLAEKGAPDNPEGELSTAEKAELGEFKTALEAMRPQFQDMATQLQAGIEAHKWDAIIGDDVSGRLPALFVGRLMQRSAEATGTKTPNIMFAAPDKSAEEDKREALREHFAKYQDKLGDRVLIVTEFIASGDNIRQLTSTLPKGVGKDIASLRVSPYFDEDYQHSSFPDSAIYYSDTGFEPPLYVRRPGDAPPQAGEGPKLTQGVIGIAKDETHALSHRRAAGHDERGNIIPQDRGRFIGEARRLLYELADEVYADTFAAPEEHRQAA